MKRLKVVLFSNWFYEYMFSFAEGMANIGHEVLLMLPDTLPEEYMKLRADNYRLVQYKHVDYRSVRDIYRMTRSINSIVREFDPDYIHIQSNGHPYFFLNFFLLRDYKIINTVHDPKRHIGDPTYPDDRILWWFSKRYTYRYITHGELQRRQLIEEHDLSPDRVGSSYHGHLGIYKRFNPEIVPEEPNTVLFMGRIWAYKGLDDFIRSADTVAKKIPNCKFIIAGRGEDFAKYREMISRPELFEIRNEYIPYEDIPVLFQRSSVVVLPYKEATQSGIIPLAYAFGKPVVATATGSIPEVVEDGKTGILVPPDSPEQIGNAIVEILSDDQKKQEMSAAALAMTKGLLNWDRIAEEMTHLYEG